MISAGDVEYGAAGAAMVGRWARPDGDGPFPAVLIAHGAPGLDAYLRTRPEALAALGYVALALDYHGGGRVLTDAADVSARMEVLNADPSYLRALAAAGLDTLLAVDDVDPARIAAVGYCFGAVVMMELARTGVDVKAVVGFHPGLWSLRPEESSNIVGRVLMCVGADDPLASPQDRLAFEAEMRTAGVDWQLNLYSGAKHRFTDPNAGAAGNPALEYHQQAAERSWRAMLDLFGETIA